MIAAAIAVLAAAMRKLVSHTPPSEAEAKLTGWLHCEAPSKAQGPPRLCQERTASASTHVLGNTTTAAAVRPAVAGADSSRCAAQPHGTHNAPSIAAPDQQRSSAGQQPVLRGQHETAEAEPRPHAALPRRRRGAHHQQEWDHAGPGQPPPGRRGKGQRWQRTGNYGRSAAWRTPWTLVHRSRLLPTHGTGTPLNGPTTQLVIQPP